MIHVMTTEEVQHLAKLARIELTPQELTEYTKEMSAILSYVSSVQELAATGTDAKETGPRFNIFRQDEVTNTPGQFSEAIVAEMPTTEGRFLKVKKILKTE